MLEREQDEFTEKRGNLSEGIHQCHTIDHHQIDKDPGALPHNEAQRVRYERNEHAASVTTKKIMLITRRKRNSNDSFPNKAGSFQKELRAPAQSINECLFQLSSAHATSHCSRLSRMQ